MFLSGIEQVAYDKGQEEQAKRMYDRLIKDGFTEKQAYKYAYGEDPQEKAD